MTFKSPRHIRLNEFAPGVIEGYRLTRLQRLGRLYRTLLFRCRIWWFRNKPASF